MNTSHFEDRVSERLSRLTDLEVSKEDKEELLKNLKDVQNLSLNSSISFGVRLLKFNISPYSPLFYSTPDGREYYRFRDFLGVDTTGDEVWAIVRECRIVTIMFRKSIQPIEKLRVDKIIILN